MIVVQLRTVMALRGGVGRRASLARIAGACQRLRVNAAFPGLGAGFLVCPCENRFTSLCDRPASLRSGSFSLLAQRKGTKRNGSPAAPPCALNARKVRERRPVAPTAHPCADGAMSAIHRAPPAGRFGRRPPPLMGTQGQGGALLRAEASAQARARAMAGAAAVLALLAPSPFWPRRSREDQARRGGARERAEFAVRPGMGCRQTPQRECAVTRARCARDRGREGALLFGVFLLGKQEKDTGPQGCGTNRHGRQSVLAQANTIRTTQSFGASRNSQPQGCGTNTHGRGWVVA